MFRLSRAALVCAVAALVAAPASHASTTELVADGRLVDASSDGRYALIQRGDAVLVVDHTTGSERAVPDGGTPLDLADHSPRVLIQRGHDLFVDDLDAGTSTLVNFDETGQWVSTIGRGKLVEDGRRVIFNAVDTPFSRILSRNLATETTTVRVTNGGLLRDASEDGRVVTYLRPLPRAYRPALLAKHPDDPPAGVVGAVVGYQIIGAAPRVVTATVFSQSQPATNDQATCLATPLSTTDGTPVDLRISQDGDAPRYRLTTIGRANLSWRVPVYDPAGGYFATDTVDGGDTSTGSYAIGVDPRSAASSTRNGPLPGPPVTTSVTVDDDRAAHWFLTGFHIWLVNLAPVIPVQRGAAVLYSGQWPDGTWTTWLEQARPAVAAGTTATDFSSLADRYSADGPSVGLKPNWAFCGPAVPKGAPADYAAITPRSSGTSAGSVAVTLAPAGKSPARYVDLTLRLAGIQVWSRHVTASSTAVLPQILPWTQGYKLYTQIATEVGAVGSITPLYRKAI